MPGLDTRVVEAWTATSWLHEPSPPASAGDLEAVEQLVGRRLPQAFRELYERHDGGSWLRNDVQLMPLLSGGELSVARASTTYREWEWPIPDEVVIFGTKATGDEIVAPYGWSREPGKHAGKMVLMPRDGKIQRLVVTFEHD